MEYSSFLLSQKDRKQEDGEEGENAEYKQAILNAISKSRGHQQKGVLSFKSSTPSASSEFIVEPLNEGSTPGILFSEVDKYL